MPALVDLTAENVDTVPCCGVKNSAHEGRRLKNCWLKRNLRHGLRAKVLLEPDGRTSGYIEYVPGEYAWRAVDARGYMVIHCVWIFAKGRQRSGLGSLMVQACLEDARKAGMHGVAALAREGPWLADARLFSGNGFETVDTAPPDYSLLAVRWNAAAALPAFRGDREQKLARYGRGLTVIRSDQCPHIAKFAGDIERAAREEFGLKPRIVTLTSHRQAQDAPTPYAVFAVIHNGRVLADHQISATRFRNIMRKL
jgi:hypothetical protein